MADEIVITLPHVGQTFPAGTVVGLYRGWIPNAGVGRPAGPAIVTATVDAQETLTFASIPQDQPAFWAAAQISGVWRGIQVTTPAGEVPAIIGIGPRGIQGVKGDQGNQGVAGAVGPAGLTWRGAWSNVTAYVVNDAVTRAGASWRCILAHTAHEPPNVTYWEPVAEKGAVGAEGPAGGPVGEEAIETKHLKASAVTSAKILDGTVADADLASPSNGIYTPLFESHTTLGNELGNASTSLLIPGKINENPGIYEGAANPIADLPFFAFFKADREVAAKTLKMRLRAWIAANGTFPEGLTFTFGLHKVKAVAGVAGKFSYELEARVASLAFAEPPNNAITHKVGADFAIPADGLYALSCENSGGAKLPAGFKALVGAAVQLRAV